jgi:hypothetical protein
MSKVDMNSRILTTITQEISRAAAHRTSGNLSETLVFQTKEVAPASILSSKAHSTGHRQQHIQEIKGFLLIEVRTLRTTGSRVRNHSTRNSRGTLFLHGDLYPHPTLDSSRVHNNPVHKGQ